MSLSRSIPVSTPIASRQWTRSSLQTFPEAPGAKGHPPRPPTEESKCVTPHSIAARMFGIAIARVSWVWSVHSTPGKRPIKTSRTRQTWRGLAMPVVSARPTARGPMSTGRRAHPSRRARTAADLRHDLLGIAQLGHHLGVDERGDLDPWHARLGEERHDLDLELGRDEVRLDLEPVTGSHLADRHAVGKLHGSPPAFAV